MKPLLAFSLALALAGCATSPLKRPPMSLEELARQAGADPAPGGEASTLLADGIAAWRERAKPGRGEDALRLFYSAARAAGESNPDIVSEALARASLVEGDLAERLPASDRAGRLQRLLRSGDAARLAVARAPGSARAQYALGAALGRRLELDRAGGLQGVEDVRDAFQKAVDTDPALDDGAPLRALGLLYLRAPGWPLSVGDPDAAIPLLERARDLAPDYPPNRLALAEAYVKTDRPRDALHEIGMLPAGIAVDAQALLPSPEPEWEADWEGWAREAQELRRKAGKP